MKYHTYSKIFILFLIFLSGCKTDIKNKTENTSTIIQNEKANDTVKLNSNLNCIIKSDSLNIKKFTIELIEDMKNKNYNSILNKMENPSKEKEMIKEMSVDFPNYFSSVFLTEIDDDEGNTIGTLNGIENSKIIYKITNNNECYSVIVGLETGLYFNLIKVNGELKIIKYEMVG